MTEEWKIIKNDKFFIYDGKYSISSNKQIKNNHTNKILKQSLCYNDYIVNISNNGIRKQIIVEYIFNKYFP